MADRTNIAAKAMPVKNKIQENHRQFDREKKKQKWLKQVFSDKIPFRNWNLVIDKSYVLKFDGKFKLP